MSIWKTGKWLVFTGNLISCTGFRLLRFFSMHSMFQHVACKTVCHTLEETISSFTGIDGRSIFLNHP
jgi:hypothetical protein